MVLAMNSYPVLLIIGCICSGICWRKKKKNYAWAIPTISIVIVYGFILTMFAQSKSEANISICLNCSCKGRLCF